MVLARYCPWMLCLMILMAAIGPPALAEGKRVALVIGNAAYKHAAELRNPLNDAKDVADTFDKLEHRHHRIDLDHAGIRVDRALRRRTPECRCGRLLLCRSRHPGRRRQLHCPNRQQARERIQPRLRADPYRHRAAADGEQAADQHHLPRCLPRQSAGAQPRQRHGRSRRSGAASRRRIRHRRSSTFKRSRAPSRRTARGATAPAEALVRQLKRDGIALTDMLLDVRRDVMLATHDRQIPWEHSALRHRFYFAPAKPVPVAPPPPPPPKPEVTQDPLELTPAQRTSLARNLNRELRRVGCDPKVRDGSWGEQPGGASALSRCHQAQL